MYTDLDEFMQIYVNSWQDADIQLGDETYDIDDIDDIINDHF